MKLHLHGFWNDDPIDFFVTLIQNVFECPIEVGSFEESEILFESVFGGGTRLYDKKWKYTFFYSGESDRRLPIFIGNRSIEGYSCILKGEPNNRNRINLPLFVYYSYLYKFTDRFIKHTYNTNRWQKSPAIQPIQEKAVCAIISNGHDDEGRRGFLDRLNSVVPVDFAGEYRNNVPRITHRFCSPAFVEEVAKYKFIVTMENSKNHTYITEKILHGFAANIIPVYWGSDLVEHYFNPARFIHVKDFSEASIQSAIGRIVELMNDESKYREMIRQPIYTNNQIPFTIRSVAKEIRQLIGVETKQQIHFLSFGGPTPKYHATLARICGEAQIFGEFASIEGYSEHTLKSDAAFWAKHGAFIETHSRGYGYWMWKPYLILRRLHQIPEGDILVYADAGCSINSGGKARFNDYIDMLNTTESGVLAFHLEHKERLFTKRKVYDSFRMSPETDESLQCLATILLLKKNANSVNLLTVWNEIVQKYDLINDNVSSNEHPGFVENRHDQSVWSMLLKRYPHIELRDETYFDEDWNNGAKYPILARRMR
jgi:hypothetical protein